MQNAPVQKYKRLVAICSAEFHEDFMRLSDRTGEAAGVLLRNLAAEALERDRRGDPIVQLTTREPGRD